MYRSALFVCLACVLLNVSLAIVCHDTFCDMVVQVPLNCAGSIIKGGGFCGCTDICAQTKGDPCGAPLGFGFMMLTVPAKKCGDGLVCQNGVCV